MYYLFIYLFLGGGALFNKEGSDTFWFVAEIQFSILAEMSANSVIIGFGNRLLLVQHMGSLLLTHIPSNPSANK